MIRSFASRETELIWQGLRSKRLPSDIQRIALRKLLYLSRAKAIVDLREPPGNSLEALKRDWLGNGRSGSTTSGVSVFDG